MTIDASRIELKFTTRNTEIDDIRRCLSTLYSTREGTQPLDRKFGLNADFIGKPIPVAQNLLAFEIIQKTEIYEKRVVVKSVTYNHEAESGKLVPVVHLTRREAEK